MERGAKRMKKKILVVLPVNEAQKAVLAGSLRGGEDRYELVYTGGVPPTAEDLRDASIVIGGFDPVLAKCAEKAEWFQLSYAGADAFAAPGVMAPGTVLTSAVGAYGLAVSEHMLAQTFTMIRRFGQYIRNQVRHEWQTMGNIISVEGSVTAVLGLGDIGGSYARKMHALGAYVIGLRRHIGEKPDYLDELRSIDELDEILPRADIVAMVLPGGPETWHIMDEARFRRMKPGAFLLNAGRGSAVDPAALKAALREGRLGGAALDVTEPEPLPPEDELWDYDNLILTPHAAGHLFLPETLNRIVRIAGDNLTRWLRDEPLRNVVPHG